MHAQAFFLPLAALDPAAAAAKSSLARAARHRPRPSIPRCSIFESGHTLFLQQLHKVRGSRHRPDGAGAGLACKRSRLLCETSEGT